MVDGRFWKDQLHGVYGGRKWLLAIDVLAAATTRVADLRELGADPAFVLAGHRGMGRVPDASEAEQLVLDTRGDSMMAQIRASERAFSDPGSEAHARVEAWDPDGTARTLPTIFGTGGAVCGRSGFGARPAEWRALEDKVLAESIWDAAGVARAPAEVAPARTEALIAAATRLDRGRGTVWAGDMREGFNGGAEYVRWVRIPEGGGPVAEFFAEHCDRVRVMPFLDGVPCSIHGMVFPERVIAFRPCEMVVLRSMVSSRFRYASAATFWEPRVEDAEAMRAVTLRVGAHLRERVGYRGAFTIDGVMTAEGFRPTELNPRIGAALLLLARGIPDLPLELLNLALVEGLELDWRPEALEALVTRGSRTERGASASVVVRVPVTEEREARLRLEPDGPVPVDEGEPADLRLALGPHPAGGFLRVVLDPERTPIGPSVAPRMVQALAWADHAWELGIGPLSAAPDLRPSGSSSR